MARKSKSATTATSGTAKLSKFDGREVIATTIKITKAGDGLSQALAIDPVEMHHGERRYVVLEANVGKVEFVPSKDDPDCLIRVHTLVAGTTTMVDEELVKAVIELQRTKLNEAKGIRALPFDGDDGAEPGTESE